MLIEAIASRWQSQIGNAATLALRLTPGTGSVAVSQAEGEGDEASRAGVRFHLQSSGATGIAPVQALPTTAAQWILYNPAANPSTVFIDRLGAWLVSGVAGAGGTLLVGICGPAQVPATIPNAVAAGIVLANANRASSRASGLIVASGATLAANPSWAPYAWMNPAGTVLGQTQLENPDTRGKLIIAPGTALALAVISPTGTTPLFAPYGSYREYATTLE